MTASYVESWTADATITRGANALRPRTYPAGPSARPIAAKAPRTDAVSCCATADRSAASGDDAWNRVFRMKNGFEAMAAKRPDTAARPMERRYVAIALEFTSDPRCLFVNLHAAPRDRCPL